MKEKLLALLIVKLKSKCNTQKLIIMIFQFKNRITGMTDTSNKKQENRILILKLEKKRVTDNEETVKWSWKSAKRCLKTLI